MAVRKNTGKKVPAKNNLEGGGEAQDFGPASRRRSGAPSAAGSRNKKHSPGGTKTHGSWTVLFWLAFAIFIFGLFLFNRDAIGESIRSIKNSAAAEPLPPEEIAVPDEKPEIRVSPPDSPEIFPPPEVSGPAPVKPAVSSPVPAPVESRGRQEGSAPREQPVSPPAARELPQKPAAAPPASPAPAASAAQTPERPPARTAAPDARPPAQKDAGQKPPPLRERALYFMQVDRGGTILRVKVNHRLPVSDSPMTDAIQALVDGPAGDEKSRGLISLIPPDTRILSATVRGDTAYISFSEDFQYNSYGVEGYAGQLRQVVFTATEFPNVRDVQILIEGRRVDYLGEGIWIGSPLNREML